MKNLKGIIKVKTKIKNKKGVRGKAAATAPTA
jgi:hypothetical protein